MLLGRRLREARKACDSKECKQGCVGESPLRDDTSCDSCSVFSGGMEVCAVCIDPLYVQTSVLSLPCGHQYHTGCVGVWLQAHASCPMCRSDISGQTVRHRFMDSRR